MDKPLSNDGPANRAEVDAPLLICSWCGRVKVQELVWQDVDVAVNQLRIFERQFAPAVSHGICPDCYLSIADLIARDDRSSFDRPGA